MSDNEKVIQDQLKGLSINRDGYGFIPKLVMQDNNLDISAKAVYAYFCSFTGAGDSCFPTRKKICYDLKISNDSLSKYLRQLEDNGYIEISQTKESGRFANNVYKLRDVKLPLRKISDTEKTAPEKTDTKNNSSKSNILSKNNSFLKKESKTSYDAVLERIKNDSLRELYLEYIKMRKMIKSPMTDRALTTLINKVERLEPASIDRQKLLLETAILNNWKSVYPLKEEANKPTTRRETVPSWLYKNQEPIIDTDEFDAFTLGQPLTTAQELKNRLKAKYGKEQNNDVV